MRAEHKAADREIRHADKADRAACQVLLAVDQSDAELRERERDQRHIYSALAQRQNGRQRAHHATTATASNRSHQTGTWNFIVEMAVT